MSDFEEEFEIPATSEVDPAAEFLAKEQVNKTFFSQFNPVSKLTVLAALLLRLRPKVFVRPASASAFFVQILSLQAELGDIGEDLGIAPAASQAAPEVADNFLTEGEVRKQYGPACNLHCMICCTSTSSSE